MLHILAFNIFCEISRSAEEIIMKKVALLVIFRHQQLVSRVLKESNLKVSN